MDGEIVFERVTLRRRMQEEMSYDLKRTVFTLLERGWKKPVRREVLGDVSFRIERGEKFGLIGPNGSGKSTLLKTLCGILRPSFGRVDVQGRIAPLIELGAGFDADLSVADNVVYYGALLGYSRERMWAALPGILEFAELSDYSRVPLKALSSGMAARLGFAVATDVEPDILLLDEVFAVGDEAFRRKSAARMRNLWRQNNTIVLVSHDLDSVAEQCQRAMWLDRGRVRGIGPAREIVAAYRESVTQASLASAARTFSPLRAVGTLDETRTDGTSLGVRGWAAAPGGERVGTAVAIFVDGAFVEPAAYGDMRPDVAEALHTDALARSGFHGTVSLAGRAPGPHTVAMALFDHVSGAFHPFGESVEFVVHEDVARAGHAPKSAVGLGS